ncbi:uncharacterized protein LOC133279841 [Pezoporus flaviventris]|uniref:uncharacterized protein LOC133279841 n=1 Tax=Pezoporus flaviventris TaxID=889875 RepID=UPI002AB06EDC|nr:uncharacterized protein LOC133279841 [Pezoporus flaviventris]
MGLDAVNHCNQLELKQFGSNIHPGVTPPTAPAFHLRYLSSGVALLLLLVIGKVFGVGASSEDKEDKVCGKLDPAHYGASHKPPFSRLRHCVMLHYLPSPSISPHFWLLGHQPGRCHPRSHICAGEQLPELSAFKSSLSTEQHLEALDLICKTKAESSKSSCPSVTLPCRHFSPLCAWKKVSVNVCKHSLFSYSKSVLKNPILEKEDGERCVRLQKQLNYKGR